jgi:hypothetical protein
MEEFMKQLYQNILEKQNEYNNFKDSYIMDFIGIDKNKYDQIQDLFEYNDFIITTDINIKSDKKTLKFKTINLNLNTRLIDNIYVIDVLYEDLFGSYMYYIKEIKKLFIEYAPNLYNVKLVLILDKKMINKLTKICNKFFEDKFCIDDIEIYEF